MNAIINGEIGQFEIRLAKIAGIDIDEQKQKARQSKQEIERSLTYNAELDTESVSMQAKQNLLFAIEYEQELKEKLSSLEQDLLIALEQNKQKLEQLRISKQNYENQRPQDLDPLLMTIMPKSPIFSLIHFLQQGISAVSDDLILKYGAYSVYSARPFR